MDQRKIAACFIVSVWYLNIVTWLMMWFIKNHNSARRRNRQLALRNRTFVRRMVGSAYLDSIIGYDDVQCVNQIRMDRRTFHYLCQMLRDHGRVKLDGVVTMEEQVCMFLHILAHHVKNRTIGSRFCRSGETISRYFNSILHGVLRLQGTLLKVPEPIPNAYPDPKWSWFENCLGALDGTYINVHVPERDKPRYRSRKGEIATNMLGVCNVDMNFIFVYPGWEGSASDSRVLRDAISRPSGLKVPTGCYYLVDGGYTNGPGYLAPYRGVRYHLSEWRNRRLPINHEEYFNMKHAQARNIIERCFGLLKMRWSILRGPSFFPIKTQFRIMTACCLLHNLIRRHMSADPIENEILNLDESESSDDDEDMIDSVQPTQEWTAWRNTLAMNMYNEWRAQV
ncbi:protein ALP1-like [Pyrus x bretschneideri]|uniref:protein ALP1-like n=1 Tax=Pyrus x bretschneideri TaxID=225117 RepID=UPI0005109BC5|nr:protein ALP1-like [Pyrus x bretschneideri]